MLHANKIEIILLKSFTGQSLVEDDKRMQDVCCKHNIHNSHNHGSQKLNNTIAL